MRCVPNRKQLQLMLRRSLKQTGETVKGSSVFNRRLHQRWLLPSTPSSDTLCLHGASMSGSAGDAPASSRTTESFALAVRIRCQHHIVRSASETHHRREDFSSAYSRRMPSVSSLQSEPPSARTPSPYGIHRKTAAFSIDRIDTTRQCLDPLRQCMASVAQSPAYLALDSSFMHS